MIRRRVGLGALLFAALSGAGCAGDPSIADRFDAERALWDANRELARLAIRPQLVSREQWGEMVDRYDAIGARFANAPADSAAGRPAHDVRSIASQAWSRAAGLALEIGDTTRAADLFRRIETTFTDLPLAVAGGAMSLGQISERRGDVVEARRAYGRAIEAWRGTREERSITTAVLQLPLKRARLAAVERDGERRAEDYAEARAFYEELLASGDPSRTLDTRSRLIDIATDLREWESALTHMRQLEEQLAGLPDPPQDPAQVRFAIADLERLALDRAADGAATLSALVDRYPKSPYAARALLALAQYRYGQEGDLAGALEALDRLDREFSDQAEWASEGRLYRGDVLEKEGRWAEALEVYRALPIDHPLTEAALRSPLRIAYHETREGDEEAARRAVDDAERFYQEVLDRFPSEISAISAREKLVETYWLGGRHREGIEQLERLAESLRGTERGGMFLLAAAEAAAVELGDREQARELFARAREWYAGTPLAERAAAEEARILGDAPR